MLGISAPSSPLLEPPTSPVLYQEEEEDDENEGKEWTSEATVHSSLAANYMSTKNYRKALLSYEKALLLYRKDYLNGGRDKQEEEQQLIHKCNAAATLHNMGLLHNTCSRYGQAVASFKEAEALYRECNTRSQQQHFCTMTRDSGGVCLEYLLAETLQQRARLHSKYNDINAAVDCHERVVAMLLEKQQQEQQTRDDNNNTTKALVKASSPTTTPCSNNNGNNTTQIVSMTSDERVQVLSQSLRNLGKLYLQRGETEEALAAYQEALELLQSRNPPNQTLVACILLAMSRIHSTRGELDLALQALLDCIACSNDADISANALVALRQLSETHRQRGDIFKARHCHAELLEAQRQSLGEYHIHLGPSHCCMAQLSEQMGQIQESLHHYRQAMEIYEHHVERDLRYADNMVHVLIEVARLDDNADVVDMASAYKKTYKQQYQQQQQQGNRRPSVTLARVLFHMAKSFLARKLIYSAQEYLVEARKEIQTVYNLDAKGKLLKSDIERALQPVQDAPSDEASHEHALLWKQRPPSPQQDSLPSDESRGELPLHHFRRRRQSLGEPKTEDSIDSIPFDEPRLRLPCPTRSATPPPRHVEPEIIKERCQSLVLRSDPKNLVPPLTFSLSTSDAGGHEIYDEVEIELVDTKDTFAAATEMDANDHPPKAALSPTSVRLTTQITVEGTKEPPIEMNPENKKNFTKYQQQTKPSWEDPPKVLRSPNRGKKSDAAGPHIDDLRLPELVMSPSQTESSGSSAEQQGKQQQQRHHERRLDIPRNTVQRKDKTPSIILEGLKGAEKLAQALCFDDGQGALFNDSLFDAQLVPNSMLQGEKKQTIRSVSSPDPVLSPTVSYQSGSRDGTKSPLGIAFLSDSDAVDSPTSERRIHFRFQDDDSSAKRNEGVDNFNSTPTTAISSLAEDIYLGNCLFSSQETTLQEPNETNENIFVDPALESHLNLTEARTGEVEVSLELMNQMDTFVRKKQKQREQKLNCQTPLASGSGTARGIIKTTEKPAPFEQEHIVGHEDFSLSEEEDNRSQTPLLSKSPPPQEESQSPALSRQSKPPRANKIDSRTSPGRKIVKALARPFLWRRHANVRKPEPKILEETPDIIQPQQLFKQQQKPLKQNDAPDNQLSASENQSTNSLISNEPTHPVSEVKLRSGSFDSVSQITIPTDFNSEIQSSQPADRNDEDWWWSMSEDGVGKWFPATHLARTVVQGVEGFLSAKPIHKDTDPRHSAGYESDPFEDLGREEEEQAATPKRELSPPPFNNKAITVRRRSSSQSPTSRSSFSRDLNARSQTGSDSTTWRPSKSLLSSRNQQPFSPRMKTRIESLERRLLEQKDRLGRNHPDVADTLVSLALLHMESKNTGTSISLILIALKIQKRAKLLEKLVYSLHILADVYSKEERYSLALACYSDIQMMEHRLYGPDHPEHANTLNRMGQVHSFEGDFFLAMEKHQEALLVLKNCFGEDLTNPAVSQTLIYIGEVYYRERNSLSMIRGSHCDDYKSFIETGMLEIIARAHEDRGSYKLALRFLEEKLQLVKNGKIKLPEIELAETLLNLGTLSNKAGVFLEALDYYKRALFIQEKLGCDEMQVTTTRVLIGSVDAQLGQFQRALRAINAALPKFCSVSEESVLVADTLYRKGILEMKLWNLDNARDHLEKSLTIYSNLVDGPSIGALGARLELARIKLLESNVDAAIRDLHDIRESQHAILGPSHPLVADTLLLLGETFATKGLEAKAMVFLDESFTMRERFLGRDHPQQAETLHQMAKVYAAKEKWSRAQQVCNSVVESRKENLGERHIDVAASLSLLGRCCVGLGHLSDAVPFFMEALQVTCEAVGESHPLVAEIHVGRGMLYMKKCDFDMSKSAFTKALTVYQEAKLNESHPSVRDVAAFLEKAERDELLCV